MEKVGALLCVGEMLSFERVAASAGRRSPSICNFVLLCACAVTRRDRGAECVCGR